MQNSKRPFAKIIQEICAEEGILCQSFSYNWIFTLAKNGVQGQIFGYQFQINSSTSQLICADKCATSEVLLSKGIPAVSHTFFMSPVNINYVGVAGNWGRMCQLLRQHGKLVCKSNEGSGGGNVYLVSNQFELEMAAHKIFNHARAMAVSPFHAIENEFRVVLLAGKVMLVYSKQIPFVEGDGISTLHELLTAYATTHSDSPLAFNDLEQDKVVLEKGQRHYLNWKHNLGQGALPVAVQDMATVAQLSTLAIAAAAVIDIQFASVDIIMTDGKYMVLEINSGVMMDYYAQLNVENYAIAKSIYKQAIQIILDKGNACASK